MKIKIPILAAMLISVLLLYGCKNSEKISNTSSGENSETTAQKTESVQVTEPEYRPAQISSNAVKELECVSGQYLRNIRALSGSRFFAVSEIFEEEISKTVMWVIDAAADEVVVRKELEGSLTEDISVTDKGIAVYIDAEKNFVFLNEELEETEKFKFESGGVFSRDGKKYYITLSNTIFETDVESGSTGLVKTTGGAALIDCIGGLAVNERYAVVHGEAIDGDYASIPEAVVDIKDGILKMLANNIDCSLCGKNNLFITQTEDGNSTEKYYFVNKNGCYEYEADTGGSYCTLIDNSDIICFHSMPSYIDFKTQTVTLYSFSADGSVRTAVVDTQKKDIGEACRINNGNIVFIDYSNGTASLNVIDMTKVSFDGRVRSERVYSLMTVDREIEELYAQQTKNDITFTSMTQLKAYTYKLEDKYNVNLFISDECGDHDVYKEYNPTSTEYSQPAEIEMISSAFRQLETVFEKYPGNFFEQFKDFEGENGINIYLVGHIKDEFSAAYTFYDYDYGCYNMIFDVSYSLEDNFAHEMWHTTESYIDNNNYEALNDYEWYQLNPEDFEYSWEYEGYEETDGSYIYCEDESDRYFIDEYSKVNPMEDKARIMEYAMRTDNDDAFSSEHIREKLTFMSAAVRDTFDTDGWNNVCWERFSSG